LEKSKAIVEIVTFEGPAEPTDKYGFKRLIEKTIDYGFCPNCKVPLVYEDESRETLVCPNGCGFKKSSEIPEDFHKLEPIEDWVARKKKEQRGASKK